MLFSLYFDLSYIELRIHVLAVFKEMESMFLRGLDKKAYGRVTLGFSAEIFSKLTLDAGGSATISKDQGDETSAQVGLRFSL